MKKVIAALTSITVFLALFLFLGIYGCSSSSSSISPRPIVFVHGGAGSADQFESQALRFASNGYPANYISAFEYDTTVSGFDFNFTTLTFKDQVAADAATAVVDSALDVYIDSVLQQTGATQVDLLGHSLGTFVSQSYLADPTRAKKIAHYVNIDGQPNTTLPGGVPTLALWAELSVPDMIRSIGGATNVTLANTTHVQASSSIESFVAMYKFFQNDKAPSTTDILSGGFDTIELAGRIVIFQSNAVPENLKLDIYEVNKTTGARMRSTPDYSSVIGGDGNFRFNNAIAGSNYEFHLTSTEDGASLVHYYYEPFIRSDYLIRLKFIEPWKMDFIMEKSANQTNLIFIRNKELIGLNAMSPNEDSLKVNNTELCAGVLPKDGSLGTPIALFIFDQGVDGVNHISGPISNVIFDNLPFVAGLDFFLSAADPPDGTISVVLEGRYSGKTQTLNVPNWQSTQGNATVQFMDY